MKATSGRQQQRPLIFRSMQTFCSIRHPKVTEAIVQLTEKEGSMFLILALVLVLLWVGGFVVFHTAGFLIHLLLIFAVISVIFHFLRGRSSTV
jgi:hypothetical protein